MDQENWKEFLQKAKEDYYRIGSVPCPAFGGESVYFNRHGWNHLFRKGRKSRETKEQSSRIELVKYSEYILRRSSEIIEVRENITNGHKAYFWAIKRYVDNKCIRIVIRKLNGGKKHFFSIMDDEKEKALQ